MEFVGGLICQCHKSGEHTHTIADPIEQNPRNHQSAKHQQDDLNNVCECNGSQTTIERVRNGENAECNKPSRQVNACDRRHRQCTQPKNRGQINQGVDAQPKNGHDGLYTVVITLRQELGHRVDASLEKDRQQKFSNQ